MKWGDGYFSGRGVALLSGRSQARGGCGTKVFVLVSPEARPFQPRTMTERRIAPGLAEKTVRGSAPLDHAPVRHANLQTHTRPSASTAFNPPKAKALDSTTSTSASRASLGTTSSAHSGSGSS